MKDYDLLVLQPNEFEFLVRDLMQKKLDCFIESFTPGKDQGIDLRCASTENGKSIIQAKRYKDYGNLIKELKKEIGKVKKLNPDRYYIATSLGLTPHNKKEIYDLFQPYIKSEEDILGKQDLNNLIGMYPEIESKHYKLWFASTNIMEQILHKAQHTWAGFELDEIRATISLYVRNHSFDQAIKILNENHYVIISGAPGVGKTTLARMLVYELLSKDYDTFTYIIGSLDEAANAFLEGKKQVFFFDDFLGASVFENGGSGFARKLLALIEKIKRVKNKTLILTTREYILSEALMHYERLKQEDISIVKCVVDIGQYTRSIKAQILYNHLSNAELGVDYIEEFLRDRKYRRIINHANYNPRIIETYIDRGLWKNVKAEEFMTQFLHLLERPESVWGMAFNMLNKESRYALLVLTTMGQPTSLEDWKNAFIHFCHRVRDDFSLENDDASWERVVKILHECFISTKMSKGLHYVTFFNPSVKDYLLHYLSIHLRDKELLIKNILFPQQLLNFIEQSRSHFSITNWYNKGNIEIGSNLILTVKELFKEIIRNPFQQSCRLEKTHEGIKKEPYKETVFVKEFAEQFTSIFISLIPDYKNRIVEIVINGNLDDFYHRTRILKIINPHIPKEEARKIMLEMSEEDILMEDYLEFIRIIKDSGNEDILESEEFRDRVEESIIVDIDSKIHSEEDYDNLVGAYEEIAEELQQPLERAFTHLENIKSDLPPVEDEDEASYEQYREGMNSYEAEEYEIDRMMESLRNN